MKSIDFGHLVLGELLARRRRGSRRRARRRARRRRAGSTTAFTSSPQSSCGMPKTAASPTFGCVSSTRLDLGRIDVDAARDDHVDLAVAEEQVAVVVEVADVADGEEARRGGSSSVFSLSLWYSKSAVAERHVDGAGLARRQLVAVVVEDADLGARPGAADGARASAATPRRHERAAALAGRVVLVDRPGPTTRACGASRRPGTARRRGPCGAATTRRSARFTSSGSASRRWNCVGTMWLVVTRYRSIELQHALRRPLVHQHDGVAEVQRRRRRTRARRCGRAASRQMCTLSSSRLRCRTCRGTSPNIEHDRRRDRTAPAAGARPSAGRSCPTCSSSPAPAVRSLGQRRRAGRP